MRRAGGVSPLLGQEGADAPSRPADHSGHASRYAVVLALAVTTYLPSAVNARARTNASRTTPRSGGATWKSHARSSLPPATSHSFTTLSSPTVAKRLPSGLIARPTTRPLCAVSVCFASRFSRSHTFTSPVRQAVTSVFLSADRPRSVSF